MVWYCYGMAESGITVTLSRSRAVALCALLVLIWSAVSPSPARARGTAPLARLAVATAAPSAAPRSVGVGDWPGAGGLASGGFNNPAETQLTAATVPTLAQSWAAWIGVTSQFVVAGGLVVTSHYADFSADGKDGLTALDAATGRIVWRRTDLTGVVSLLADGQSVFASMQILLPGAVSLSYVLMSLNLSTGTTRWFTPDPADDYDYQQMAATGGTLYVNTRAGQVMAVRESDGKRLWLAQDAYSFGVTVSGGRVYTVDSNSYPGDPGVPVALSAATGALVWQGDTGGLTGEAPFVADGLIISTSGTQFLSTTVVDVFTTASCGVPATSFWCKPLWSRTMPNPVASVTAAGKVLVVGTNAPSGSKTVQALNVATGAALWSGTTIGWPFLSTAGTVTYAVSGSTAVGGVGEEMQAFVTAGCGKAVCAPIWTARIPGVDDDQVATTIVVSHGRLYENLALGGLQVYAPGTSVPAFNQSGTDMSGATAVSWAPGRLDLFAVDVYGRLVHRWWTATAGWSKWESLGGVNLVGSPAATAWAPGRLDVFVRTATGGLDHIYFQGRWSKFETRITSGVAGDPAAASWNRHLDVFYPTAGSGNAYPVVDLVFAGSWQLPVRVPGGPAYGRQVAAIATAPGSVTVFDVGAIGLIRAQLTGGAWKRWAQVPGPTSNGIYVQYGLSVTSAQPGHLDLFTTLQGGGIGRTTFVNGAYTSSQYYPAYMNTEPSAVSIAPGRIDVFGIGTDFALLQLSSAHSWITLTP